VAANLRDRGTRLRLDDVPGRHLGGAAHQRSSGGVDAGAAGAHAEVHARRGSSV